MDKSGEGWKVSYCVGFQPKLVGGLVGNKDSQFPLGHAFLVLSKDDEIVAASGLIPNYATRGTPGTVFSGLVLGRPVDGRVKEEVLGPYIDADELQSRTVSISNEQAEKLVKAIKAEKEKTNKGLKYDAWSDNCIDRALGWIDQAGIEGFDDLKTCMNRKEHPSKSPFSVTGDIYKLLGDKGLGRLEFPGGYSSIENARRHFRSRLGEDGIQMTPTPMFDRVWNSLEELQTLNDQERLAKLDVQRRAIVQRIFEKIHNKKPLTHSEQTILTQFVRQKRAARGLKDPKLLPDGRTRSML